MNNQKNSVNDNRCYLHSKIPVCILHSCILEKANKNNGLCPECKMQCFLKCRCLHSGANAVTTGPVEVISECNADPIYLRYMLVPDVCTPVLTKPILGMCFDRGRV